MVLEIPGGLFGQNDVRETPVSQITGTFYWSAAGIGFRPVTSVTQAFSSLNGAIKNDEAGDEAFRMSVNLPHGAVVTGVIIYGDDAVKLAQLVRDPINAAGFSLMASENMNTEDTTITNATIDNQTYKYWLSQTLQAGKSINGARITYTLE